MTTGAKRILIDSYGSNDEAIQEALEQARTYAEDAGCPKSCVLLVATKNQLDPAATGSAIGRELASDLKKGDTIQDGGLFVQAKTKKTAKFLEDDIVIAIHPDKQMLHIADDSSAECIIVVPWTAEEVSGWRKAWHDTLEVIGEYPAPIYPPIENPVLRKGLEKLDAVLMGAGLTKEIDRAKAVRLLQKLHDANELTASPADVRAWATGEGWHSRDADKLEDICERVLDGRWFNLKSEYSWSEDIVDKLRELAKSPGAGSDMSNG